MKKHTSTMTTIFHEERIHHATIVEKETVRESGDYEKPGLEIFVYPQRKANHKGGFVDATVILTLEIFDDDDRERLAQLLREYASHGRLSVTVSQKESWLFLR
jgi:hypothetical protein